MVPPCEEGVVMRHHVSRYSRLAAMINTRAVPVLRTVKAFTSTKSLKFIVSLTSYLITCLSAIKIAFSLLRLPCATKYLKMQICLHQAIRERIVFENLAIRN